MFYIKREDFTVEKLTARNEVIKAQIVECQEKLEEGAFHVFGGYDLEIEFLQGEYQINCETIPKLERIENKLKGLFTNFNTSDINASDTLANLAQQVEQFRNQGVGSL